MLKHDPTPKLSHFVYSKSENIQNSGHSWSKVFRKRDDQPVQPAVVSLSWNKCLEPLVQVLKWGSKHSPGWECDTGDVLMSIKLLSPKWFGKHMGWDLSNNAVPSLAPLGSHNSES
jgi:hypothetical protein